MRKTLKVFNRLHILRRAYSEKGKRERGLARGAAVWSLIRCGVVSPGALNGSVPGNPVTVDPLQPASLAHLELCSQGSSVS